MSSKTQWLSGLYYADFISFHSPTQLCGGGTTKSNSNELPISVPLSFFGPLLGKNERDFFFPLKFRKIVEKSKKRFSSTYFFCIIESDSYI
ncbi:MAG: hypothetical protein KHY48_07345 [Streptococcus parasanguinis]|nr:hypothetical protein [Streptococcus parasanguinis]